MVTLPLMGLRAWNLVTDPYDHVQLADNWKKVDQHRHVFGEGVQIPTGGIEDGAITGAKLASDLSPAGSSPYFQAYRSTAVSYSNGQRVIFDAGSDPNGWYDFGTGSFVPTVVGMYRLSWYISLNVTITADKAIEANLRTGAAVVIGRSGPSFQRGAVYPAAAGGTVLAAFNGTTDSVHVEVATDTGGAVALATGIDLTHFEAEYIGV